MDVSTIMHIMNILLLLFHLFIMLNYANDKKRKTEKGTIIAYQ